MLKRLAAAIALLLIFWPWNGTSYAEKLPDRTFLAFIGTPLHSGTEGIKVTVLPSREQAGYEVSVEFAAADTKRLVYTERISARVAMEFFDKIASLGFPESHNSAFIADEYAGYALQIQVANGESAHKVSFVGGEAKRSALVTWLFSDSLVASKIDLLLAECSPSASSLPQMELNYLQSLRK